MRWWWWTKDEKGSGSFLKKRTKTFPFWCQLSGVLGRGRRITSALHGFHCRFVWAPVGKSFLLLFFKKEALAFFLLP
jgi:hypothetical protein